MKKRNCRMTDTEKTAHDRAVRIRKMTDAQICDLIDSTYGKGMEEGAKLADKSQEAPAIRANAVNRFINYLTAHVGDRNGIGHGTLMNMSNELEKAIAAGIFNDEFTEAKE